LVVRSFATLITTQNGAAITTLDVRQHLHAGHHLASQQAPARLIPGLQSIPGFDVTLLLRHVISGSLALAFVIHTCRAHRRDFSHDAHHHGS
jgi:hypothetical protein